MGWLELCNHFGIEYKEGSNNAEIKCPMCLDDPGKHMALHASSGAYKCWRQANHRGRNPSKLIKKLCSVSDAEAVNLVNTYFTGHTYKRVYDPSTFKVPTSVDKPEGVLPFNFQTIEERAFIKYLKDRNLDPGFVIRRYKLHWAMSGKYIGRLVIPILVNDEWYSWTARAINSEEEIRYKTASIKECNSKPSYHLFDQTNLTGGKVLVITEGPFDAITVASAFIPGVHATSLFGKQISAEQIELLTKIAPLYDRVIIGLDKDAYVSTLSIKTQLLWYLPNIESIKLEDKDWNEMDSTKIRSILNV